MPTYDYECMDCNHQMEAFHSMNADPLRDCPACGKPSLRRKIGPGAGLIFKGSGFYQTDYRSDSYKQSVEAEKKPAPEKEKKAAPEKKAVSKPAPAASA